MARTIVVAGAGVGLGAALSRRFGREGFRVALVARGRDRIAALAETLAAEGVEAAAFPADLARPAEIPALVSAIRERFGRIDVLSYAPSGMDGFTAAADLTPAVMQRLLDLYLLTPIALVQAVLPELRERGDGSILVTQGISATHPMPGLSGLGPAMAAARNYVQSLAGEISGPGLYAATLQIGAMVTGSAAHTALLSGAIQPDVDLTGITEIAPATIAETLWQMHAKREVSDLQLP